MHTFTELKKNLKKDFVTFKVIRLAVLGDSATQFLMQSLRGMGYDDGINFEIMEADFNQIERQVYDSNSDLYQFHPDFIIVFHAAHKLLAAYNKSDPSQYAQLAANRMETIIQLTNFIGKQTLAPIIYYNYTEVDDAVFGNFANKESSSFLFQLRKLNYELMVFAEQHPTFYVCDLSSLQNRFGKQLFFQSPMYINTEMVLSLDVLPEVARQTIDIIQTVRGKFKKCLILDLDNTLWGGIIGDDGIENIQVGSLGIGKAFTEFQYWIKKLKNRGVILAVCSKNTDAIAREPFQKHPDMVLRLDDFAVFKANWDNKVNNIRQIQQELNIGFDSMVFLDDNPFERNMVKEQIPELTVPELPEDPAEYLEFLYRQHLFETASFSAEDKERNKLYQVEAEREVLKNLFDSEDDFLQSLEMVSLVEPFNSFNMPRVAQLSQRSNQFNLRTIRYTEADIHHMILTGNMHSFAFSLQDKFGDNGLICVIILKPENKTVLFVDTWFMSCRVLKRHMENFALNTIVQFAKDHGYEEIIGEYIPSPKNEMVRNHYASLGFVPAGDYFSLAVSSYQPKKCFIKAKASTWKTQISYAS